MARQSLLNSSLGSDWNEWDPWTVGMDFAAEPMQDMAAVPQGLWFFLNAAVRACLSWLSKSGRRRLMWMVSRRRKIGSWAGSLSNLVSNLVLEHGIRLGTH